ncbi:MAG: sugar phosphate isomerase/epimerase [Firmicutes bacterium]|nr:sugar phosphate isomerase/epimerase [Bacillota bacterium]
MTKLKFSVFTVGTPDFTIPETIAKLKEWGYDGVEWRVAEGPPHNPVPLPPRESWYWTYNQSTINIENVKEEIKRAKTLCDQAELEICCLTTYLQPNEFEQIEQVLNAASSVQCPRIRVMPPNFTGKENYNKLFFQTQQHIVTLEELAQKYGVKIVFEIHMGNIIPSASAAYRLVSPFDSNAVGIIFDPGNMVHEGYEEYELGVQLLGPYLDHVHIKDARPVYSQTNGKGKWDIQWCPIGEGMVRFKKLIETLKASNYTGYLSFEDFSNEHDSAYKLEHNIHYLKSLL